MPTRPRETDPDRLARWSEVRMKVGSRIRDTRVRKGLTQEALALESGLSRNQLIEVEHGRRSLLFERLVDLADVLEVEPGELLQAGPQDH